MTSRENDLSLLDVPGIYTITTGYNELIEERVNQFFDNVLNFLGYGDRVRAAFTERGAWDLVHMVGPTALPSEERYIRLLKVREYITASVLVVRDISNNCQVASAHYLTAELVVKLREGIVED